MTGSLRVHWRWLVSLLLLVILFIPPRRYAVPSGLPFELDPYRLVIGVLILLWMLSALSDQDMGVRSSSLEGPLLLFIAGVFGSLVVNAGRVSYYEAEVVKELSVLVGYFLAFYLVVNLLRSRAACETALAVLVIGGAVLAALSVIEQRTGWSPFTHLDHYIPFIQPAGVDVKLAAQLIEEGRGTRAFGSAEHPIALGAMFAMLAPVAAALAITQRRMIWVGCLTLLVIGSFGTLSRTPILMFFAWAVMFSIFRWSDSKRFIPLALISLTLVHLAMPGSLGLIRMYFNPARVLKEQSTTPE